MQLAVPAAQLALQLDQRMYRKEGRWCLLLDPPVVTPWVVT
jgi:hypothetical protein